LVVAASSADRVNADLPACPRKKRCVDRTSYEQPCKRRKSLNGSVANSARLTAAALILAAAVAAAPPATAGGDKCTSSSKSIDMPQYSGPWPDNFKFEAKVCARRSGSTVTVYAAIKWDAPTGAGQVATFDAAVARLQVKKSQSGEDKVVKSRDFDIRSRLEEGDGSYTTSTISHDLGTAQGLGDLELRLNWNDDGEADKVYLLSASPAV
jgi:hypothetical protein